MRWPIVLLLGVLATGPAASQQDTSLAPPALEPAYHFVAPMGQAVPFDPNGCLFWEGRFHLFYIFQDPDLPHGGHCWGHASSTDLIQWDHHPTALRAEEGDPERGIFSRR